MPHIKFLEQIREKAKQKPQKIIYPEAALDIRILQGAILAAQAKICYPVLIGKSSEIQALAAKHQLQIPNTCNIVEINTEDAQGRYLSEVLLSKRKHKGLKIQAALELLQDPHYFATMLLETDNGQGVVAGAISTTAQTFKPVFQIIKTKEKFHHASSFFFMLKDERILLFADCAININPDSQTLAEIAIDTAQTAEQFGIKPQVAFLSFSTKGSANSPEVSKVQEAVSLAQAKAPHYNFDGEMQVDAALVPQVAQLKCPKSIIQGDANILIFPNLESGNIAYKLVQRLGKFQAIGPIVQGLRKPVNDLSRGCSVDDVVQISAITSLQAQNLPFGIWSTFSPSISDPQL